jgi:ParB family chromosome partitioning protein
MKTPKLLQQGPIAVSDVQIAGRLRPVSEAGVASLVRSIEETGVMKDAIHVRQGKNGKLTLIAGAHRLAAATKLGWTEIEAKVWADVSDDWARLMEIDDNLAGAEMNALDTAVFLATRKEIYERLHPEAKHGGDRRSPKFRNQTDTMSVWSFAEATAEKFGLSDRQIRRLVAAGIALGPDQVRSLRAAPQQVSLKDLQDIAKIKATGDRYAVIERLSFGRAKSAADALRSLRSEADPKPPTSKQDKEFLALMTAWTRAGADARRRFLDEIGTAGGEE